MFKTETAKGRTYGECVIAEISSIHLVNGQFVTTLRICNKPDPLPREDAIAYYTDKLRRVWNEINA